ncbi:SDR family NAD(P)-dependent oxidoreductase, partial [Candidatus Woesearchaeota archaeon]|nr:SDR family NAD(P)-dependent oxidoreductase [Candidatus Woesearchaeota archaeon]
MSTKNNVTFQFEGQNVLITGGAQGIGLQIAGSFLAAGSQVTVWDYSEQALSVASQELAKFGNRFCATQANVAELDSCLKAAQRLPGPLDVLVNNA